MTKSQLVVALVALLAVTGAGSALEMAQNTRQQASQAQRADPKPSPYAVAGLSLGGRVRFDSTAYREYQCDPSEQFNGFIWCTKTVPESESRGSFTATYSILHSKDGVAHYINRSQRPAFWAPNEANEDIDRYSRKIGESPRFAPLPRRAGLPDGTIAIWGAVELELLDGASLKVLAQDQSPKRGILVDVIGDLTRSAREGFPVYRIVGGPGFVWAASFEQSGRGTLRFFAVDASAFTPAASNITPPAAPPAPVAAIPAPRIDQPSPRFCASINNSEGIDNADCRYNRRLEQQLDAADRLFKQKDYKGASRAYMSAFGDTPFRPVDGDAHGQMIASLTAAKQHEQAMHEILRRDRLLARDDYRLWSDIAFVARRLALQTSAESADNVLRTAFAKFPSKLQSRVWPLLPVPLIFHLRDHKFSREDVFGADPESAMTRRNIETFLASNPSDNFLDFAYFAIGDFDKALSVNPKSILVDVIHYAKAYETIEALSNEAMKYFIDHPSDDDSDQPLGTILNNFSAQASVAKPHLEAILRDAPSSSHGDDAAFWLGWIAFHESKFREALPYLSQAMIIGNGDYRSRAVRLSVRALQKFRPHEQVALVDLMNGLSQQPALWYVASRSAYRNFNYALAMETARRGLRALKIPPERLPPTTARETIVAALKAARAGADSSTEFYADPNLVELPYILQASLEISGYESSLRSFTTERPENFAKRVRFIVTKYSTPSHNADGNQISPPNPADALHTDYRQALRLIDLALESTRNNAQHARLREWLHYRKIRILVKFDPAGVAPAVSTMEREFPTSQLMDDALAEQLFVEVRIDKNLSAAQSTFRKIVEKYPKGNAVDNAHTWMAILLHCQGRTNEANKMNWEIIRRFPLTRHAYYSFVRLYRPPETADCNSESEAIAYGPKYQTLRTTSLYKGPSKGFEPLITIGSGIRVNADKRQDEWYTVKLGDGIAFISAQDVKCVAHCSDQR
jgi:tetratricopeptide (TPR) repeat protein